MPAIQPCAPAKSGEDTGSAGCRFAKSEERTSHDQFRRGNRRLLAQGSLNLKLAQALEKLAAGKLVFDYVDIGDLPAYNDDLWVNPPASVLRMKEQVAKADGLLMLTPEYNRSYAGILKNAMDWGSRPYGQGVWQGKATAVAGTSPGSIGAAVGQARLRADLASLSTVLAPSPR
ncbi:NAD(P)H-dependent oxidoreductase [Paracoccus cavernae]|uniref:NAD(P)H-dependent oxidoreductase n=1 Tax=Paracoccus cavernae TaxID=1571207 RepID=A0ABT8D6S0_9RHOB|nr:NAD(P)H-dependent oxidoreductase [Paracoccus cavernae]